MKSDELIRNWLRDTGRKQSWLADKVGCSDSRMSAWLNQGVTPKLAARKALASETGLDVANEEGWQ